MPASSVALVRVEDIARAYDFGASHPLRPERVLLAYEHFERLGLVDLPHVQIVPSRSASDEEIAGAHDREFLDVVKGIDAGTLPESAGFEFGLGTGDNPIFEQMHAASAAVCGASLTAAELVARGEVRRSFNPAGGLHHARRREASGFCIYNDPAVAIAKLLALQPDWRVMYVDVDVHHGDGVQWIFYDEPRVLTVSFHQLGAFFYPGTGYANEVGEGAGRGTSVNVPLSAYTGEDDYVWALEEVLFAVADSFRPHVVLTQLGADTHWGDPLASLGLTMTAYPKIARILDDTARRFAHDRWVATGGGGYQATTIVPRVWAIHFAQMCGASQLIPTEWLEDRRPGDVSRPYRREIERSVSAVLEMCLPRLQELVAAAT